jgi:hypothetical protein
VLGGGVKMTNASMMGIAANSPNWKALAFGSLGFTIRGPWHSKVTLGGEFAQQPQQLKEIPGATVPTPLAYSIRIAPGRDIALTMDFGLVQLGGALGPGLDIQARHQFSTGSRIDSETGASFIMVSCC